MSSVREFRNGRPRIIQILLLLALVVMGNAALLQAFVMGVKSLHPSKSHGKPASVKAGSPRPQ